MIASGLMVLALVSLAVVPSADAQVCGNGVIEIGEDCDDGNVLPGDCCSVVCTLIEVGAICREAKSECDLVEVCDGVSGLCPTDSGTPDNDGDGFCDAIDVCPWVPDPEQLDRDFDGVGDACDPCTNLTGAEITTARLRVRKLDFAPGEQRIKMKGTFEIAPAPAFDPLANGMRFVLFSAGLAILDITVPGGAFDPTAEPEAQRGWLHRGLGFEYADKAATVAGIQRIAARPAGGELSVTVYGKGGAYAAPEGSELVMTFIANPASPEGQCADAIFTEDECRIRNRGGKLVCH
jgi:cysteine-rich repeat protein